MSEHDTAARHQADRAIHVTVRCFSHVRSALGVDSLVLALPEGSTAAAVEAEVRAKAPGRLDAMPWRIAVNRVFAGPGTRLAEGDEVALIPPVQGG